MKSRETENRRDVRFSDEIIVETLPAADASEHLQRSDSTNTTYGDSSSSAAGANNASTSGSASSIAAVFGSASGRNAPSTKTTTMSSTTTTTTTPFSKIPTASAGKDDKREMGLRRLKGRFANLSDTINQMGQSPCIIL